jgi:DNA-binding transcriptional ArsR family regulator
MGLWAKSVVIFNAIREHGQQSIRSLADRTGLSKSSVHRHLQAMDRRDRSPEAPLWETEAGCAWLLRLVIATLFVFVYGLLPICKLKIDDERSRATGVYATSVGGATPWS